MSNDARTAWDALDVTSPSRVSFLRRPPRDTISVLLGAFDPPTNAHLAVVGAAARATASSGVLCLTKTLLARPEDGLVPVRDRVGLLTTVADDHGLGFALANRGTYIEVSEALAAEGWNAMFVIGSDKLAQLEDPSFYPDGAAGVERTFASVRFVVVPRPDRSDRRPGLRWLEASKVFSTAGDEALSATEVRRRVKAGERIDHLVPRAVGFALGGYTQAT